MPRGYNKLGRGIGGGNPYPNCRFFPWLPRRWWAYPTTSQLNLASSQPTNIPVILPKSTPGYSKKQEIEMLTQQTQILENQLKSLKKRLEELKI